MSPVTVVVPVVAVNVNVRLLAAASASTVPEINILPPPPAVVSRVFAPSVTLSLMVMSWLAVVMPAFSVVVPPLLRVIEASPAPVSVPATVIEPPLGAWIVTGSLKVMALMVIACVPVAWPIRMLPIAEAVSENAATSVAVNPKSVPAGAPPMTIGRAAVDGCRVNVPVVVIVLLPPPSTISSAVIVMLPRPVPMVMAFCVNVPVSPVPAVKVIARSVVDILPATVILPAAPPIRKVIGSR